MVAVLCPLCVLFSVSSASLFLSCSVSLCIACYNVPNNRPVSKRAVVTVVFRERGDGVLVGSPHPDQVGVVVRPYEGVQGMTGNEGKV